MQHDQAFDLLEEYVLGTLSRDLSDDVDAHLDTGCRECSRRLRELGEVSALMADSVTQKKPSNELKKRIMASFQNNPGVMQDKESAGKRMNLSKTLAFVSAAVAIILAVWSWNLTDELEIVKSELNKSHTQIARLQKEIESYMDATSLLAEPGMQFIDLAGVAPNEQAFGKVVMEADSGQAVVYMYELPPTPEGMIYQLWMVRDGVPTSVGTFTVNEDGSAKLMLDPMPDMGSIASFDVTIEPVGGTAKPTGMMYLTSPGVVQSPNIQ